MTTPKEYKNSQQKRWLTAIFVLIPTIILLGQLGQLFPYTGLAAIVVYPFIVVLNFLILLATVFITRQLNKILYFVSWTFSLILTIYFVIALFPQEFRPSVTKQIQYSISAIRNYDKIPMSDLDLPETVIDFSRNDCQIKDAEERYIVALYKYRKSIPLDGSFSIYRSVMPYGTESSIKNLEEIPHKLQGHNKTIWQILTRLKK